MNILVVNDDGVHATGIEVLAAELRKIATVYVVAPLEERSTTGHTLTLDNPLRVVEIENNVYGCSGYPADCTLIALAHILKDKNIDLVVSGINRGANLGQDIYYSGTVAAAREAVFRGLPAIAVSSVVDFIRGNDSDFYYNTAAEVISRCIENDIHKYLRPNELVNINVPNLKYAELSGIELCASGFRKYSEEVFERKDFKNKPYYWIGGRYAGFEGGEKTDCFAVENGKISFSALNVLSHSPDTSNYWETFIRKVY